MSCLLEQIYEETSRECATKNTSFFGVYFFFPSILMVRGLSGPGYQRYVFNPKYLTKSNEQSFEKHRAAPGICLALD